MNTCVKVSKSNHNYPASNGLCHICNNNQKLRVFQLAHFIPLNEANFDVEIEHFEKQLERAYKLCKECDLTLKKTIQKQNIKLGIKLTKLTKKGIDLMDLTMATNGVSVKTKQLVFKSAIFYTIILFSILNVTHLSLKLGIFSNINALLPETILLCGLKVKSLYSSVVGRSSALLKNSFNNVDFISLTESLENGIYMLVNNSFFTDLYVVAELVLTEISKFLNSLVVLSSFWKNTDSSALLCCVGLLLQVIWALLNDTKYKRNILLLLLWSVLLSFEGGYITFKSNYDIILKIACTFFIMILMIYKSRSKVIKMRKRNISTRGIKKVSEELGHISDEEVDFSNNEVKDVPLPVPKFTPMFEQQCNTNKFCDNSTATKTLNGCFSTFNYDVTDNSDLNISLNKLHISAPKTTVIHTNVARPKPVLSPARLQNIVPCRDTNVSLLKSNSFNCSQCTNQNYNESQFTMLPQNPYYHNISCSPFFPDHMLCTFPRFSCASNLSNASFQPIINNEQLVYFAPNYLQPRNMFDVFSSERVFENSYTGQLINRTGNSFDNIKNISGILNSKSFNTAIKKN
ncbi:hypothetical protein FQA39_LY01273 [Lamprigera yunnana]|nr:hypothetical protein FQA39_LY01273 [Lamprigera yunnana]